MIVSLKAKKSVKLNAKKAGYGMPWSFLSDSHGVPSVNVSFCSGYGYIDVFHLTLGVAIYSYHTPNVHNLTP